MTSIAIDRLDGLSSSTAIKGPCRVATTANITLSGLQTIDGVTLAAEDRVLVKDQTTASQNGIYVVDTGPWRRAADFTRNRDIKRGAVVVVTDGTLNAGPYRLASADPITLDTTAITFEVFEDYSEILTSLPETPEKYGASVDGTASANDAAFALLEATVPGEFVDMRGRTYAVTSVPTGARYHHGGWTVDGDYTAASGYATTIRDFMDIAADGVTNDTAAVAAIVGQPEIDLEEKTIVVDSWPTTAEFYNGYIQVGANIPVPVGPARGPFPSVHVTAIVDPEAGHGNKPPAVYQRSDSGRLRIIYGLKDNHYDDERCTVMMMTSVDMGHTWTEYAPIAKDPDYELAPWSWGNLDGDVFAFLSNRRGRSGGDGSSQVWGTNSAFRTTDGETWTEIPLTLSASLSSANFRCFFHGPILRRTAIYGGAALNHWVAYAYSQNRIAVIETTTNGATWGTITQAVAPAMGSAPHLATWMALTEMSVSACEHVAKATMLIRDDNMNNGTGGLRFCKSTDLLTWSVPIACDIPLFDSPPFVIPYSRTRHYLIGRTGVNVKAIPYYESHLLIMEIDPEEFYDSDGASGWKSWRVLANFPSWMLSYPSFFQKRHGGEWYGLVVAGEGQARNIPSGGTNSTHAGGNTLFLISPHAAPTTSLQAIYGSTPVEEIGYNGDFQVWQDYDYDVEITGTTTRLQAADGFGFMRDLNVTGHYAKRRLGPKGKDVLELGRLSGDTNDDYINLLTVMPADMVRSCRGKKISVLWEALLGEDFSGSYEGLNLVVRYSASDVDTITTSDASVVGDVSLVDGVNAPASRIDYQPARETFRMPMDAVACWALLRYQPTGTAGANDWVRLNSFRFIDGHHWRPSRLRPYDKVLASCQQLLAKTWPNSELAVDSGGRTGGAISAISVGTGVGVGFAWNWRFPVRMRKAPSVTAYSPATGASGKFRDVTGTADVDVSTNYIDRDGCTFLNNAVVTAGRLGTVHGRAWAGYW